MFAMLPCTMGPRSITHPSVPFLAISYLYCDSSSRSSSWVGLFEGLEFSAMEVTAKRGGKVKEAFMVRCEWLRINFLAIYS
jgi:hypothetical protein